MAVEFRCSSCNKKLKVKDELAGKKIKCPGCGSPTAVPEPKAQEPNPDLNTTESILTLNLTKFKNKAIDPDAEDVNLDELEGAVVLRKKREAQARAKPPSQPLHPVDWVMGLLFFPIAAIMAIVWLVQGQRSRGLKLLLLCGVMMLFLIGVGVLFWIAMNTAARSAGG
jgi:phage FluMu protein Com